MYKLRKPGMMMRLPAKVLNHKSLAGRLSLLLIVFFHALFISFRSYSHGTDDSPIILENFRHPQYGDKNPEIPEMMLYGARARTIGVITYLDNLKLEWYDGALDRIKARVTTPYGIYDRSTNIIRGDKDIKMESEKMTVEGLGFVADSQKKTIFIKSRVRVVLMGGLDSEERKRLKN